MFLFLFLSTFFYSNDDKHNDLTLIILFFSVKKRTLKNQGLNGATRRAFKQALSTALALIIYMMRWPVHAQLGPDQSECITYKYLYIYICIYVYHFDQVQVELSLLFFFSFIYLFISVHTMGPSPATTTTTNPTKSSTTTTTTTTTTTSTSPSQPPTYVSSWGSWVFGGLFFSAVIVIVFLLYKIQQRRYPNFSYSTRYFNDSSSEMENLVPPSSHPYQGLTMDGEGDRGGNSNRSKNGGGERGESNTAFEETESSV